VTIPHDTTNKLRRNLRSQIKDRFTGKKVCLLLSAGADSTLLAMIAHSLKFDIHAFSYERVGFPSEDCQQAENTAKHFGWDFTKVVIPKENPKDCFKRMINLGCTKKTELEILYPFTHLIEEISSQGFSLVMTGFGQPIPDNRKASISCRNNPEKWWNHACSNDLLSTASTKCIEFAADKGIEIFNPLHETKFKKLMHGLTMEQMHKPYWKAVWKDLYPKDFEDLGLLKKGRSTNLQIGGGIDAFFKPLLDDAKINYRGYTDIRHLVKLWSKHTNTEMTLKTDDTKTSFKPYLMADVHKQSKKALFSVVTTFAGGGGSSTGYKLAGGKILLASEFVPAAIDTYLANYPDTPIDGNDIRKITRKNGRKGVLEWFAHHNIKCGEYDILDGSPPCSTFSVSGVGEGKNEKKNVSYSDTTQDRIGYLIHEFVYLANCTKPKVCIIENVPTIAKSDVFGHALRRLKRQGYIVGHKVLTASYFGVPQRRKRMFAVAVRPDIASAVGIETEQDVLSLYPQGSSYQPSVKDAIGDIEVDMRERNLILKEIRKGTQYEVIRGLRKNPEHPAKLSHDHPNFMNLYFNIYRSAWNDPVPTITQSGNQLGGRGGVFHPTEDRTFTIKELLRLTALPDDFKLTGTFNQRCERLGRMVPPLMTFALARSIYEKVLKPTQGMEYKE